MRKTLAIIFTFLIVATLTIGLVACGGTNSNGSSKSSNDSNSSSSSLSPREKFESEMSTPVTCQGVSFRYNKSNDKVEFYHFESISGMSVTIAGDFKPSYYADGSVKIVDGSYTWLYRLDVAKYSSNHSARMILSSGDSRMESLLVGSSIKTKICDNIAQAFDDYYNYVLVHTGYEL